MNTRDVTFALLLRLSQGVKSVDDYYGECCAFCGECGSSCDIQCETNIAVDLLKTEYKDLYDKHLNQLAEK